jgi:hypothetical protein
VIFRVFFVPLKQFLHFLELFLGLKINSKKNYPFGLGRARRPDPLRPAPASPVARPGGAHLAKLEAATAARRLQPAGPGRASQEGLGPRANKGGPLAPTNPSRRPVSRARAAGPSTALCSAAA